jgi:hypothetical protein
MRIVTESSWCTAMAMSASWSPRDAARLGQLVAARRGSAAALTPDIDGGAADPLVAFGAPDDVYDAAGDGPGMGGIGTGAATRAWVR